MEYGSMVHALEEVRRLLKSTGVLIDMHPVAEAVPIEIHQGGKIDLAGHLLVRQWSTDYQQADNALAEITQRGLFVVERESVFDSLTYYDSVEEMSTNLKQAFEKYARDAQSAGEDVPQAEALAARADELMRAAVSGAELRAHERIHISRLRPT
jgi:predicted RNase H-like HicB family nuclease